MTGKPWIVIPARGGSTGVPRKNVRLLGGLPLIARSINTANAAAVAGIVVVTDDDEIAEIAQAFGAAVVREPKTTGKATLDEVMLRTVPDLIALGATENDVLLTMQPTCPFVSAARIDQAMQKFSSGAGSVITVVDDRHLGWKLDVHGKPTPDYAARVNRQALPTHYRESGAIIGARIRDVLEKKTRIVEPIELIELGENEWLDIDTWSDWAVAEHLVSRRRIVLRTDAARELGMGHAYRTLALAQALARHEITIVISKDKPLGAKFFADYPFEIHTVAGDEEFISFARNRAADLVILDQLDSDRALVESLHEFAKVVTFEDLGSGAEAADLLISDLYENPRVPAARQLSGVANAILAPAFETLPRISQYSADVNEILVLFGGTDPSDLAKKTLSALESISFDGKVRVVRGLGADPLNVGDFKLNVELLSNVKNMPALMQSADLALSSAGRTITELSCIGVPTLCLAQNAKELTHSHTTEANGVVMLGLGSEVTIESLAGSISGLIADAAKRKALHENALAATHGRSNANIVDRILALLSL